MAQNFARFEEELVSEARGLSKTAVVWGLGMSTPRPKGYIQGTLCHFPTGRWKPGSYRERRGWSTSRSPAMPPGWTGVAVAGGHRETCRCFPPHGSARTPHAGRKSPAAVADSRLALIEAGLSRAALLTSPSASSRPLGGSRTARLCRQGPISSKRISATRDPSDRSPGRRDGDGASQQVKPDIRSKARLPGPGG